MQKTPFDHPSPAASSQMITYHVKYSSSMTLYFVTTLQDRTLDFPSRHPSRTRVHPAQLKISAASCYSSG